MNPTTPIAILTMALALMMTPAVDAEEPVRVFTSPTSCVPVETDVGPPPQVVVDDECIKEKVNVLAPDL